jgi:hypothetical protein
MIYENNRHYHCRRAEQEFKLGCQAQHPKVRSTHFKLFDLHVRCFLKAGETVEFDVVASAIGRPTGRDPFHGRARRGEPV